jgi:hypothetical protein
MGQPETTPDSPKAANPKTVLRQSLAQKPKPEKAAPAAAGSGVPETEMVTWTKVSEEDGVQTFKREIPGSPIIAFRAEGVIDAPLLRVVSLVLDSERATRWVDSLGETRRLRQISPFEWVEYDHIETPFIMKDRDFVLHCRLTVDAKKQKVVEVMNSTTDELAPVTDHVRGVVDHSYFVATAIEGGKKTFVEIEIHADPMGSVPKWIVNLAQTSAPIRTVRAIRREVMAPDLKINAEMARALGVSGQP